MILSITKPNKSENGASVVEFALVLPLLLLLLFGIIEFSIILFDKAVLTNASREGARNGIVRCVPRKDLDCIEGIIRDYCEDHLITFGSAPATPTVTVSFPPIDEFGQDLIVNVKFIYDFLLVPSFIPGLPGTITLEAESVMKYE